MKKAEMNNGFQNLTKQNLKDFALSNYLVGQIVKGLKSSQTKSGVKEYDPSDVKASIETKISKPTTHPKTRERLQRVLTWLEGESNVIEVDFLRSLRPDKKIEVLNARIEELEVQEQVIAQETKDILRKANKFVKNQ